MRLMQARGLPGEMVRIRVLRDVSTSPSEFEPPCSPPSPCHRDTRSPGTLTAIGCGVLTQVGVRGTLRGQAIRLVL